MREILFKAKALDSGEWVEGCLIIDYVSGQYFIHQNGNSVNESQKIREEGCLRFLAFEINPDTTCQYTGLTDKNGQKIWENDILRGHRNVNDLVRVVFGEFNVIDVETLEVVDSVIGWHTKVIETDALSRCEPFCPPMPLTDFYINRSEYEVVGNFSDNSDLVEVE